jgi:hypothetical protein
MRQSQKEAIDDVLEEYREVTGHQFPPDFGDSSMRFVREAGQQIADLVAGDSMGEGHYRARLTGDAVEHESSLVDRPDFRTVFAEGFDTTGPILHTSIAVIVEPKTGSAGYGVTSA